MLVAGSVTGLARTQEYPRDPGAASSEVSRGGAGKRAKKSKNENLTKSKSQGKAARSGNPLGLPLLKNIVQDQKAIWTSPSRVRFQDAAWLVPLGGLTAGLFATDHATSKHLSNSPDRLDRSRKISDFGAASLVSAAGGVYLWGKITHDNHKRETGLLSGEALLNCLAVTSLIQVAAGRERPFQDGGSGNFFHQGTSFPSDHAAAAWSVAGVIAHEYPGPLTKLLAYGLASAVSASRISAKKHFPSDILVGSTVGWFVGQQVYRAHHNPELGGGSWETFSEVLHEESRQPKNMGSPYVPLDSWVYPALERLVARGYVQTAFLGMRPWIRLECARLIDEARERFPEEKADPQAGRLFRALEKEFAEELNLLGGGTNRRLRLELVYTRVTGISGKPLTDGFHFGQTIVNDFGRPYEEGFNSVAGFSGWASDGPFVAYIRGEYEHAPSAPALSQEARQVISRGLPAVSPPIPVASVNRFHLLDSYLAVNLENWQVSFGKQSLWWGPDLAGPMLFSDNAEPIDMFRINRVTPFKLPSILGWLGPMRVEFFLGQLSGHQFILGPSGLAGQFGRSLDRQPFIHGQKISFKPTPNFEFSVFRTTIFSGSVFALTWHRFLNSLFSTTNTRGGSESKPGDRRSGVDFTYRIPKLRNWLTFYADGFADDEISPLGYWDRSAWSAGIYMPQIPKLHKMDFRAEGVYTDLPIGGAVAHGFFYSNNTWRSGYTNNGNLIGSWIGRQGQGAQAWSNYWLSPRSKIQFSYRHQKVSQQFIPLGGTLSDATVQADLLVRPGWSISSSVQYEKWKFPALSSGAQTNVTTSFQLTFWPHGWSK